MRVRIPLCVLGSLAFLLLPACLGHDWDNQSDLIVNNHSRCDLTIFVDGWEAGRVRHDSTRTVDDIGDGRHVLEAKDEDGRLVERRNIDLDRGENYFWRISSC